RPGGIGSRRHSRRCVRRNWDRRERRSYSMMDGMMNHRSWVQTPFNAISSVLVFVGPHAPTVTRIDGKTSGDSANAPPSVVASYCFTMVVAVVSVARVRKLANLPVDTNPATAAIPAPEQTELITSVRGTFGTVIVTVFAAFIADI